MDWPAWPAGTVSAASGAVSCSLYTLRLAIPQVPQSAYSFALNSLDYLATKFQYLAFPRLNYEPRSHENPSISLATHGPKRNRKS